MAGVLMVRGDTDTEGRRPCDDRQECEPCRCKPGNFKGCHRRQKLGGGAVSIPDWRKVCQWPPWGPESTAPSPGAVCQEQDKAPSLTASWDMTPDTQLVHEKLNFSLNLLPHQIFEMLSRIKPVCPWSCLYSESGKESANLGLFPNNPALSLGFPFCKAWRLHRWRGPLLFLLFSAPSTTPRCPFSKWLQA